MHSCENMRDGYVNAVRAVLQRGEQVSPRGMPTREISPAHITLECPWDSLATGIGRKLVPAIGYAEGLQLIAGISTPELLIRIAPEFAKFREDDGTFWGAYGPRADGQTTDVVRLLAREPDTRQAVITVFDGQKDLWPDAATRSKDIPCTIALHFLRRTRGLDLHVYMRSNDVWKGLPYDVVQFTLLQIAIANVLDISVGWYHHHATSLHLYDSDRDAATLLQRLTSYEAHRIHEARWANHSVGVRRKHSWEEIQRRASLLLEGRLPDKATVSEELMHTTLKKYQ